MDIEVLNRYCKDKQVPEKVQNLISSLPKEDLGVALHLIQTLSPSSNTLRVFIDLLADIKHRDKLSFSDVLERLDFSSILVSGGSSKDKQIKLKNSLLRIRYPEKFSIEDRLNQLNAEIKEEYGVSLIFPDEFEGDQLQVSFSFRTIDKLSSFSRKLEELSKSNKLQEIFSILKGEV